MAEVDGVMMAADIGGCSTNSFSDNGENAADVDAADGRRMSGGR